MIVETSEPFVLLKDFIVVSDDLAIVVNEGISLGIVVGDIDVVAGVQGFLEFSKCISLKYCVFLHVFDGYAIPGNLMIGSCSWSEGTSWFHGIV